VAVVISTLGEEPEKLEHAVRSFLEQTHPDVTVVLSTVEDDPAVVWAATDGVEVVTMPPEQHPGMGPRGSFAQINQALPYVDGFDWFVFASGNDHAFPTKLEAELARCREAQRRVCSSAYSFVDRCRPDASGDRAPMRYDYTAHLVSNIVSDCSLVDMALIREYGPFDLEMNNMAFWHLWLTIYENEGDVFTQVHTPQWVYYRVEGSGVTKRMRCPARMAKENRDRERMLALHGYHKMAPHVRARHGKR
jgi:hypothetical protein